MKNTAPALMVALILTGCTGTQIKVNPDPATMTSSYSQPRYKTVGVGNLSSTSGAMSEKFSDTIRVTGFADKSLYPVRPDDKTDLTVETDFRVSLDEHTGSAFAKGFFTGFTLFLLEPVFWYDFDYTVEGTAIVTRAGERIGKYEAKSDSTLSLKWLNLSDVKTQGATALEKAQKSVYLQLINQIR